jgi:hypothetical protein
VRDNLTIIAREQGRIVDRRSYHNIWLDRGRQYLSEIMEATLFNPFTNKRNDRPLYIGLGIGGTGQSSATQVPPLVGPYPGTNNQSNQDPTITQLERPVRITGGTTTYPGAGGDLWLNDPPATFGPPHYHFASNEVTYQVNYSGPGGHIVYGIFTQMPLSEVALFTDESAVVPLGSDPRSNPPMAYRTFPTVLMTPATELEIRWTVRF